MEITTRLMEPGEAREVQRIGRRAFRGLEGLFVTKPKQALVAVRDGKIAGAIQFKFYHTPGRKIGYFDYAFVDRECHSQGIGGVLYKAAADYLWEQGCDALSALVKDDNVASWKLFQKNGFERVSLPELARRFGIPGMLRLCLFTVLNIAVGMDYYVAERDQQSRPSGKGGSARQISAYLLANLFLSLFFLFGRTQNIGAFFAAYVIFLAGGILAGYVGTLFSKRAWRFRLNNGGWLVCAFVSLLGDVYPMVGNWYPESYENSAAFRREMGVNALCGWLFVLVLTLVPLAAKSPPVLTQYLGSLGCLFLLYRVIPVYPFESFGGGRVCRWNRGVYILMAAASLAVCALSRIR